MQMTNLGKKRRKDKKRKKHISLFIKISRLSECVVRGAERKEDEKMVSMALSF